MSPPYLPPLSNEDWTALWLSIKLATLSTGLLLLISIPLAWWLKHASKPIKVLIESLVTLPLVLPPTVLGYYLLISFSPDTFLGSQWFALTGSSLAFSFYGLVFGSVLYSLPFVMQPIFNAFDKIPHYYLESAMNLNSYRFDTLRSIALPMCKKPILMGCGLGFAHTLGEFGVVLMIGGNIPGETQVIAIQLYDHVESLQYAAANTLSLLLLALSFCLLIICYGIHYYASCSTQTSN